MLPNAYSVLLFVLDPVTERERERRKLVILLSQVHGLL